MAKRKRGALGAPRALRALASALALRSSPPRSGIGIEARTPSLPVQAPRSCTLGGVNRACHTGQKIQGMSRRVRRA